MIKKILTILIAVFSISAISAQVKSVIELRCDYVDRIGEYIKENCHTFSIVKYDSDGNAVESIPFESDGLLRSKSIYKYDSDGNQVEKTIYKDGENDNTVFKRYDYKGNRIERKTYIGEALIPDSIIEYIFKYYD